MNDPPEGYIQMMEGTWKREKPIIITGVDKLPIKHDCITESFVNGVRENILYILGLSLPPSHKINKEPRTKLFKGTNKSVLSQITFHLENNDHKPVESNGETICFTCPLIKF